jgi:hypothetical protein
MTKARVLSIIAVFAGIIIACCGVSILIYALNKYKGAKVEAPACPTLPTNFSESDLVGTWVGRYFGNVDKLIIRENGTYKQVYSDETLNFESDWQKWYIEHDSHGFVRLHLAGMRRCDGLDNVCNNPGGGLPDGEQALNPCEPGSLSFEGEVILFVIGTTSDVPRGVLLLQPKIGGSEWNYTFRLDAIDVP